MSDLQRWSIGFSEYGFFQTHDDDGHWVEHEKAQEIIDKLKREIEGAYIEGFMAKWGSLYIEESYALDAAKEYAEAYIKKYQGGL